MVNILLGILHDKSVGMFNVHLVEFCDRKVNMVHTQLVVLCESRLITVKMPPVGTNDETQYTVGMKIVSLCDVSKVVKMQLVDLCGYC
jgi:hypothetical protein